MRLLKNSSVWDHKIVRVFDGNSESDNGFFDNKSDRTNHIFIDDLSEEYNEILYRGWAFNFGISIDKNSFYLFYKRPKMNKKGE